VFVCVFFRSPIDSCLRERSERVVSRLKIACLDGRAAGLIFDLAVVYDFVCARAVFCARRRVLAFSKMEARKGNVKEKAVKTEKGCERKGEHRMNRKRDNLLPV
jgi:hypothetical protein